MSTTVKLGKMKPTGLRNAPHSQKANVGRGGGPWAPPAKGRKRYAAEPTRADGGPHVGYLFGKYE